MKILIITTQVPYPPFRGDRVRIFNILKNLLQNNELKILTFIRNDSEIQNIEALKKIGFNIEAIELPYYKSVLNLRRSFFSSTPLQVSAYRSKKMETRIAELTSKENYDVIYFNLLVTAQYFSYVKSHASLKVIDFTDANSLYLSRLINFINHPVKKLIYKIEMQRIIKYEKISKKFDTLFICSPVDKQFLEENHTHQNIRLLLNGIDLNTFHFEEVVPQKNRIIFVGNMGYYPNIDAALYFVKEIFPLILIKVPTAKFYIVGQNPPKVIRELQNSSVIVKGFVKDIKSEYQLSEVNVAPLRLGSGTPYKTIEALALGIPTVSSTLSASGLPEQIKRFVITADNPSVFANKVLEVLGSNKLKRELIEMGLPIITEVVNWEVICKNFEKYLEQRINLAKNN